MNASRAFTSATRDCIVTCGCSGCCVYDSSSDCDSESDCDSISAGVGTDSASVDVAHLLPWPWLVRPTGQRLTSYSAWRKGVRR